MSDFSTNKKRVLISGGGIAGLSLAIQLRKKGWQPEVIEKADQPRTGGYSMDIFATGWDAMERIGILSDVLGLPHPIKFLEMHDGKVGRYIKLPLARIKTMLKGKYTYVRRPDLEMVLHDKAESLGVTLSYGLSIERLDESETEATAKLTDGSSRQVDLVVGADGLHSNVRQLTFGDSKQYEKYLGCYVAGFEVPNRSIVNSDALAIFEEENHQVTCYPAGDTTMNALFTFRSPELDFMSPAEITDMIRSDFRGNSIAEKILHDKNLSAPTYFSPVTQIIMPQWHNDSRVVLVGDACGCLTFMSGQGSHLAMAGAYVLAEELERHDDLPAAFAAYQSFLQPIIQSKQSEASKFASIFIPRQHSKPWLRRTAVKLMMSWFVTNFLSKFFNIKSSLANYK